MRVLGLDLSLTSSGAVVIIDGQAADHQVADHRAIKPVLKGETRTKSGKGKSLTDLQRAERLILIRDSVASVINQFRVQAVAIEGYAFSKSSSSVTGLAELGGVIRVMLAERGIPFFTLPVGQVRSLIIGDGGAKKEAAQKWLKALSFNYDTEDEGDALLLAMALNHVLNIGSRQNLTPFQLERLDAMVELCGRQIGVEQFAKLMEDDNGTE